VISAPERPRLRVELRGAPLQLMEALAGYEGPPKILEYLLDGPGGTGKSRGVAHVLFWLGYQYPGIRIIVVRKTRASLTESFCKTWEQDVVPAGHAMLNGPRRLNRHSYDFGNGSELILAGLDTDTRLYSTDYDVWYVQELIEISLDEHEKARRALRNWNGERRGTPGAIPFQLLVADTNPHVPWHWVNKRYAPNGPYPRLESRHWDNPALYDAARERWTPEGAAYIESLSKLTGPRRERLYKGKWHQAEGLVWSSYDPAVHLVTRSEVPEIGWHFASQDWGFTAPGVLQIWGVAKGTGHLYRLHEVYRRGENVNWWAARVGEYHKRYDLRRVICDPEDADAISIFNEHLGTPAGNHEPMARIAQPANNKRASSGVGDIGGLDLVRQYLAERRLFLVRDANEHVDLGRPSEGIRGLSDLGLPDRTEQEVEGYVFKKRSYGQLAAKSGEREIDLTDDSVPDHGCDALRYAVMFAHNRDLSDPPPPKRFPPNSRGALYGHDLSD